MEAYPQEGSLWGGHIPGAASVPWSRVVNDDGTFKSHEELEQIYLDEAGLKRDDHRLLPERRTVEPHVVCAEVSSGIRQCEEL
jgi:hypothetical protein